MKSKNPKPLNKSTGPKDVKQKSFDMRLLWAGAAALVVVVALTAVLIWHYGESIVATVNGMAIRESEVRHELLTNQNIREWASWGVPDAELRGIAVDQLAVNRLYEDYARRNNIGIPANTAPQDMMQLVTDAIIADPALFADFEVHLIDYEAHAAAILERAMAGEDFDYLVATYSQDGMPPEGYTFIEGAMVIEFCEATRALEIGEISGLVHTQFGIHIIQRIEPPNPDAIMRPPGMPAPEDGEEEYLLGAKHILIRSVTTIDAVTAGFEEKFGAADIVHRSALDNVPVN